VIAESCAIAGAPTAIAKTNLGQAETISFRSIFILKRVVTNVGIGSTEADRYQAKLMQMTGRINGASGHSMIAAGERPGSAVLATLIR
jgi:hypothetical protein